MEYYEELGFQAYSQVLELETYSKFEFEPYSEELENFEELEDDFYREDDIISVDSTGIETKSNFEGQSRDVSLENNRQVDSERQRSSGDNNSTLFCIEQQEFVNLSGSFVVPFKMQGKDPSGICVVITANTETLFNKAKFFTIPLKGPCFMVVEFFSCSNPSNVILLTASTLDEASQLPKPVQFLNGKALRLPTGERIKYPPGATSVSTHSKYQVRLIFKEKASGSPIVSLLSKAFWSVPRKDYVQEALEGKLFLQRSLGQQFGLNPHLQILPASMDRLRMETSSFSNE